MKKLLTVKKIVAEIKRFNLPVFIWGYMLTADVLTRLLTSFGVKVESWVTDKAGVDKAGVISKNELIKNYSQYILVRGFEDALKFSEEEIKSMWKGCRKVYAFSDAYDFIYEPISKVFFIKNRVAFDEVYDNLADELSKKSLVAYVQAKVLKNHKSIVPYVVTPQYFLNPSLWKKSDSDVMLDCGAFDGDSILDFLKFSGGNYKQIIACEPDENNLEKLNNTIRLNEINNVLILNVGLSSKKGTLKFNSNGNVWSNISDSGNLEVPVDTIDHIESDTGGGISIIKMDIEGFEFPDLKGGENTIKINRPILAISAYHKRDDVLKIYQYVNSIVRNYKFYFRCHTNITCDAVLYAIPEERAV